MKKYEVSKETVAVIGIGENKSKVVEYDTENIINESAYEVMDYSCSYFGSSYKGRVEGSKNILGSSYKLPIIVEEEWNLIFFPTESPDTIDCIWLNLSLIDDIEEEHKECIITFKNGQKIKVPVSKSSINNQILRATRLQYLLNVRKGKKN